MKTIFEIEAEIRELSLKAMRNPAETIQLGVLAGLVPLIHEIAQLWHAQEASNEMARAWQGAWADVDRSGIKIDAAHDARALIGRLNEMPIIDCQNQPSDPTVPGADPCIPLLEPLDDFNIRRRRECNKPGYRAGTTHPNGIACPVCAGPLHDNKPETRLYSYPGQLHVECVGCGFSGRRVA